MTEKRKRRWYQFSLRTLLVFVLLVSIGMSWLGVTLERARRQREAVEAIERAGGLVFYDHLIVHVHHGIVDGPSDEPPGPKWARAFLGDAFFFDVAWVRDFRDFGDHEASHLKALKDLRILELCHTQITDAGLEHLGGLAYLTTLDLEDTQVTDAGLKHLEGLTNLTTLDLTGTQVTPEGVKKLQEALPECKIVYDE